MTMTTTHRAICAGDTVQIGHVAVTRAAARAAVLTIGAHSVCLTERQVDQLIVALIATQT